MEKFKQMRNKETKAKSLKAWFLLCMMMGVGMLAVGQVPSGFTIVETHHDDITWYEVNSNCGPHLGAVYNNKVIGLGGWTAVKYSHGLFFFQYQGEDDSWFVYDKDGNEAKFGDSQVVDFKEINGKLYIFNNYKVYDEHKRLLFLCDISFECDHLDCLLIRKGNDVYLKNRENGKTGLYDLVNDRQVLAPLFNGINVIEGANGESFLKASLKYKSQYGMYDFSGEEILAPEFEDCDYLGKDLFGFKMNGCWGVMDRSGKIIIPLSRHYTSIKYSRTLKMFTFEKETATEYFKGECDANGVQKSIEKTGTKSKPQTQATETKPKQETKTNQGTTPTPQPMPTPNYGNVGYGGYGNGGNYGGNASSSQQHGYVTETYQDNCPVCYGTGKCSNCHGHGTYNDYTNTTRDCPSCVGGRCSTCGGSGKVTKTRTVWK